MSNPTYSFGPLPPQMASNPNLAMHPGGFQQPMMQQPMMVHHNQPMTTNSAPSSIIPEPMNSILQWINTNTADAKRNIFIAKDMNVAQMRQTMFDLLEKWDEYFVEYEKYGAQLAAETDFQALQQKCATTTLDMVGQMKKIKNKGRSYDGSTRLKEMAQKFKRILDVNITNKLRIENSQVNRVQKDNSATFVQKNHTVIAPKQPGSSTPPTSVSNPQLGIQNPNGSPYASPMSTNDVYSNGTGSPQMMHNSNPHMYAPGSGSPMMSGGCVACRASLAPGMRFCGACGAQQVVQPVVQPVVAKFCGGCGTPSNGTRFCGNCGQTL